MYYTIACPHCKKTLKASDSLAGQKARCPHCRNTFVVLLSAPAPTTVGQTGEGAPGPAPAEGGGAAGVGEGHEEVGEKKSDGTNVSLLVSGAIGLTLTVAFYVVLILPFHTYYLGAVFAHRGWVPYATVLCAAWAAGILILKARKFRRQRDSMLFDVLPTDIAQEINLKNVADFQINLRSLPCDPKCSFLINRVARALGHFQSRGSRTEVAGLLSSQSDIDATAVDSSYTMLKVFIWAIPILGFIGTVLGISDAVGGFTGALEKAQDIAVLKSSLGSVTTGLAVAFDTTLVALLLSVIIMFPMNTLQKAEEDLLNSIDDYCNENLVRRLDDTRSDKTGAPEEVIRKAVASAMAGQEAEFGRWTRQLEAVGASVTRHVVEGWKGIHYEIQKTQMLQHDQTQTSMNEAVRSLGQSAATVAQGMQAVAQELTSAREAQAQASRQAAAQFAEVRDASQKAADQERARFEEIGSRMLSALLESHRQLASHVETLTSAVQAESAAVRQSLAAAAQERCDSDACRAALTASETAAERLRTVAAALAQQHDIALAPDADGGARGLIHRLWRRVTGKRGNHG